MKSLDNLLEQHELTHGNLLRKNLASVQSADFWKRKQSRMFKEWPMFWRITLFLKCHFALPGLPDRVEGKDTVVEFLEQFLGRERGMFTGWELHDIRIYPGGDPDLVFAELDGQGVVAQSGYQYRQSTSACFVSPTDVSATGVNT
jgi:hypothetical protein